MTASDNQLQLWMMQAAAHREPTRSSPFELLWMNSFAVKAAVASKLRRG